MLTVIHLFARPNANIRSHSFLHIILFILFVLVYSKFIYLSQECLFLLHVLLCYIMRLSIQIISYEVAFF